MDWTPLQIEKALLRLEDSLPRLVAEHADAQAFSSAVRRESALLEAHAGDFAPYVSRRIDAMLVALVRTGKGHDRVHAPAESRGPSGAAQPRQEQSHG